MNYLAHIALSGDSPEHQVGGFLGDFHRGPLCGQFPASIEVGMIVHRKVDAFVDRQPELQAFLRHFEKPLRRYAGIVADIIYDHILAREWNRYYTLPLNQFCENFYRHLGHYESILPFAARRFLHHAPTLGWLQSYQDVNNLPYILERVGQRLKKPVALNRAIPIFLLHQSHIVQEFHELYPRLQNFVNTSLAEIDLN